MQISDFLLGDADTKGKHYCVACEREEGIVGISGGLRDYKDAYLFMDVDDAIEHRDACQYKYDQALFVVGHNGTDWYEHDTGATFEPCKDRGALILQKMIWAARHVGAGITDVDPSEHYPDFGSW